MMKRREAVQAHQQDRHVRILQEIDCLLGVHDLYRTGALRFKRAIDGPFVDDDDKHATPPIARLRELENAARQVEANSDPDDPDYLKWLFILIAPAVENGDGVRADRFVRGTLA